MAFIRESNNDDEAPVSTSTSSAPIIGSTTTAKTAPKKGSGGFTNISSYIDANRPQAAALGQGIASNINKQADVAKTGVTTAKTNFQAATTPEVTRVNDGQGLVQSSFEKANAGQRLDADNLDKFGKFRNNIGQTLQEDSSLNNVRAEAQKAQGYTESAQNSAGRTQLLSNFYGQPTYTAGQKRLDQLLLQTTPGLTKSMTQQAQAATTGLVDSVEAERTSQNALISDVTAKRNALQQMINEQSSQYMSGLKTDLDKNLVDRQAERTANFNTTQKSIQDQIAAGKFQEAQAGFKDFTGQDADFSGLKSDDYFTRGLDSYWKNQFLGGMGGHINDYRNMVNQSITPYLRESEQLNINSAATDPLRSKYQALSDLAGLSSEDRILTEAGVAATPVGTVDMNAMQAALANAAGVRDNINSRLQSTYRDYQDDAENAYKIAKYIEQNGISGRDVVPRMSEIQNATGVGSGRTGDPFTRGAQISADEMDLRQINETLAKYAALRAQR